MRVSQVESEERPAKALHRGERLEIAVLHGLLGLGAVLEDAPGRTIEALIVAPCDEPHGLVIAPDDEPAKLDVARVLIVQRGLCHRNARLLLELLRQFLGVMLMRLEQFESLLQ